MAPKDCYLLVFTHSVQSPFLDCRSNKRLASKEQGKSYGCHFWNLEGDALFSLSLVLLACSERASCHGCCAQGEPHVASKPTGNWILPTSTSVRLESDPPWWSFETSCHLEAVLRETLNERIKINCLQIPLPQKQWDKMLF